MNTRKERTIEELKQLKEEYSLLLDNVENELSQRQVNAEFMDRWDFVIETGQASFFTGLSEETILSMQSDCQKLVSNLFGDSFRIVDTDH